MNRLCVLIITILGIALKSYAWWLPEASHEYYDSISAMAIRSYPITEGDHVSFVYNDQLGFDIEYVEYGGYKQFNLPKKDSKGRVIMRNKKVVNEPTWAHHFIVHGIRERGKKYIENDFDRVLMYFIGDDISRPEHAVTWGNLEPNKIGANKPDGRFTIPIYMSNTYQLGDKTMKFPKRLRALKFTGLNLSCDTTWVYIIQDCNYHLESYRIKIEEEERKRAAQNPQDFKIYIDVPRDGYFYERPDFNIKYKYTLDFDTIIPNSAALVPPRFVGGEDALKRYLTNNINKEVYSKCHNTYHKFDISLTVTDTGGIRDIKITGNIEKLLADEIERALLFSDWQSGYKISGNTQEKVNWPIKIKGVQIFINWEDADIAILASKPVNKMAGFYAVVQPTPIYRYADRDSLQIRLQDGHGGDGLSYSLDRGRVVELVDTVGDYAKIYWDSSSTYIKRGQKLETVNFGYIPLNSITQPDPLPEEWYYEEYTAPDGYEISFEVGDDTVTSSGTTVTVDKDKKVIRIGYMWTICYLNGEPFVKTYNITNL